jgi:hypothetical protein
MEGSQQLAIISPISYPQMLTHLTSHPTQLYVAKVGRMGIKLYVAFLPPILIREETLLCSVGSD